jgi:hypothetical protein
MGGGGGVGARRGGSVLGSTCTIKAVTCVFQSPGNRQHMPYKVEWVERLHICIHDIKKVRDYFWYFFPLYNQSQTYSLR